jgi:NAD(P)-dependent dehydrogenase (short-subunit alcohol dehydrogenase family)
MTIRIFKDATAVITGAATGIGKALAIELSNRGCTVVLTDRQIVLAEEVAAEIVKKGGNAWARELDVCDYDLMQTIVDEAVAKTGRLDYMFNNAGIGIGGFADEYEISDWNTTIDVNLRGVTNGVQACYRTMVAQGFGHIVNTASMAGLVPTASQIAYSTTKFAVSGLSQALRVEAEMKGVRVSALCPGAIDTPLLTGGVYGRLPKGITREKAAAYWAKLKPMPVEDFAVEALDKVAKNVPLIIVPGWWRGMYWIYRLSWGLWFKNAKKDLGRVMRMTRRK